LENNFEIGIIVKPQGIGGELRILPTTDDPERFALLDEVFIRPRTLGTGNENSASYKIISARRHKGLVLLKLEGINDRNAAQEMVGGVLTIPPEMALPLGADEYFVRDLIGLNVETEDGQALGAVSDVFPTGANDVYIVKDANGESFMLPAIKNVVLDVSLAHKKMTVRLIEGLLELKA